MLKTFNDIVLKIKNLCSQNAAVDDNGTQDWFFKLPALIDIFDFHDIYNVYETGHFYKCFPDRSLKILIRKLSKQNVSKT